MLQTKKEIMEILEMPEAEYREEIMPLARETWKKQSNELTGVAMLGYTNVCRNQCLYCGMRAANSQVKRYRLTCDQMRQSVDTAVEHRFSNIFLIAGEDPKYDFNNVLENVSYAKSKGMHVSLAAGIFSKNEYQMLHDAGVDEYVLKFEMSDPETFARLKPTSDYRKRLQAAEWIKEIGMELASGNIVDFPGQGLDQLAEDMLLMKKLGISWAPVIPYLPVINTPLAEEGGRGSLLLNLKEISILRMMMPEVNLTAQQPGEDLRNGLADPEGNYQALMAGANYLFLDLLPVAQAESFHVIDNRVVSTMKHLENMAERSGMKLVI